MLTNQKAKQLLQPIVLWWCAHYELNPLKSGMAGGAGVNPLERLDCHIPLSSPFGKVKLLLVGIMFFSSSWLFSSSVLVFLFCAFWSMELSFLTKPHQFLEPHHSVSLRL